jgi:hypothetical protein
MMPSVGLDFAADEWRGLVDLLGRLHTQLLMRAQELQARLQQASDSGTIGEDIRGYLALTELAPLGHAERAELEADLRLQLQALEHLTADLNALQGLVHLAAVTGRADDQ